MAPPTDMSSKLHLEQLGVPDAAAIRRRWRALPQTANGRLLTVIAAVLGLYVLRVTAVPTLYNGVPLLLIIPVAVVGIDRGTWIGALAGLAAYAVFLVWSSGQQLASDAPLDHVVRGCLYALVGAFTGWAADHLRTAEQRQRHLADALGDMVSAHDPEGRYLYASSAAQSLLGYEPRELIGRSAYDFFHPHDVAAVRDIHDETLELPEVATAVYRVRRADGRYTWLETVSRAIRERGEVKEILCSSRDVTVRETERLANEDDREGLLGQLRQVLAERSIDPVFQRIVELGTDRVVGYEALARFPLIASRPPNVWFAHAEQVGLGEALELLAVERAIEVFSAQHSSAWLSVNASPDTVCSPQMLQIARACPPDRLVIELTEHTAIPDYGGFNDAVAELRDYGVRIAVDDAGAGFASLRHILDVRPEIIKLDMTLTRHVHRDKARRALASALADFAISLGAHVVAEGIEEQAELDELRHLGIEYGQGYFLGRPAPPQEQFGN